MDELPLASHGPLPSKRVGASGLFFDEVGRVLLVQAAYGGHHWDMPGGVVDPDETPLAAARREVREEIGLLEPLGRLLVVDWMPSEKRTLTEAQRRAEWSETLLDGIAFTFDGGVLSAEEIAAIRLQPSELRAYAFHSVPEAIGLLPARNSRELAAAVQARATKTVAYLENGFPPAAG